ncbi:MAG: nicotinate (nicotinamide) nucleotide adenylyltransferase [Bacteroidetes bacterium]|nr:nicotinate (nicotinamide) nucleotide adenylyltransferase [Bacteroidota bacterium]
MERGKKKYIGIFGGTFDPPHKGHISIAEKAMKQLSLSVIYFVPAYLPPHKLDRDFVTAKQRLAMLKLAVKGHRNFKISTIELKRRGISYTIDTLKTFKSRFPKADFVLIIGADNLAQFYSWKSPKEILKLASIAVYKRKGFNRSFKKKDIAFQKIKGDLLQVSSTEIRQRLRNGVSVTKLLPKQIMQYIKRYSLYVNPPDSR